LATVLYTHKRPLGCLFKIQHNNIVYYTIIIYVLCIMCMVYSDGSFGFRNKFNPWHFGLIYCSAYLYHIYVSVDLLIQKQNVAGIVDDFIFVLCVQREVFEQKYLT